MVELIDHNTISLPHVGWVCDKCGEPYNSKKRPDMHMCSACGKETTWSLPEERIDGYRRRLQDVSFGEEVVVIPDMAAGMKGMVYRSRKNVVFIGDPRVEKEIRVIDVSKFEMLKLDEYKHSHPGDPIQYIEVRQ